MLPRSRAASPTPARSRGEGVGINVADAAFFVSVTLSDLRRRHRQQRPDRAAGPVFAGGRSSSGSVTISSFAAASATAARSRPGSRHLIAATAPAAPLGLQSVRRRHHQQRLDFGGGDGICRRRCHFAGGISNSGTISGGNNIGIDSAGNASFPAASATADVTIAAGIRRHSTAQRVTDISPAASPTGTIVDGGISRAAPHGIGGHKSVRSVADCGYEQQRMISARRQRNSRHMHATFAGGIRTTARLSAAGVSNGILVSRRRPFAGGISNGGTIRAGTPALGWTASPALPVASATAARSRARASGIFVNSVAGSAAPAPVAASATAATISAGPTAFSSTASQLCGRHQATAARSRAGKRIVVEHVASFAGGVSNRGTISAGAATAALASSRTPSFPAASPTPARSGAWPLGIGILRGFHLCRRHHQQQGRHDLGGPRRHSDRLPRRNPVSSFIGNIVNSGTISGKDRHHHLRQHHHRRDRRQRHDRGDEPRHPDRQRERDSRRARPRSTSPAAPLPAASPISA